VLMEDRRPDAKIAVEAVYASMEDTNPNAATVVEAVFVNTEG
jgi:hypothetical protein